MKRSLFLLFPFFLLLATPVFADPCGMVPPIYPGEKIPLARVGEQRTYVFYENGVESFVIRPGFTGKVEEFGMLIPFPNPPAVRKVADNVFEHVAAAIDPPEVVVDLRLRLQEFALGGRGRFKQSRRLGNSLEVLDRDEVRVVREEAVGMYEVAVLEAGSAKALNKWMDEHDYQYPKGMDKPCGEYIEAGWCFVAVKTKVAAKGNVDAKPGQRTTDSNLPAGSSFDGYVQAMGFRFESEELVVPMRLSAFNEGDLRNIVYLLTDSPKKVRSIPEEYVVRQVSGEQLKTNVTSPLPLRIVGGTEKDIPEYRRKSLPAERDPTQHNGIAKELFAFDLLAVNSETLSLPQEENEKVLLNIGERLGLRGNAIDVLNRGALTEERKQAAQEGLKSIADMTLTVIDGDFPREVLAKTNLTFAEYKMPSSRNGSMFYDAKTKQPVTAQPGVLQTGRLEFNTPELREVSPHGSRIAWLIGLGFAAIVLGGVFMVMRR